MDDCNHSALELLPEKEKRMRCRRCHLTMPRTELEGDYCLECYETSGAKHYTFDELEDAQGGVSRYRLRAVWGDREDSITIPIRHACKMPTANHESGG